MKHVCCSRVRLQWPTWDPNERSGEACARQRNRSRCRVKKSRNLWKNKTRTLDYNAPNLKFQPNSCVEVLVMPKPSSSIKPSTLKLRTRFPNRYTTLLPGLPGLFRAWCTESAHIWFCLGAFSEWVRTEQEKGEAREGQKKQTCCTISPPPSYTQVILMSFTRELSIMSCAAR